MSLPVTGWGDSVRTSAFLVLRMSWTTDAVAMTNGVYVDRKNKQMYDGVERLGEIALQCGSALTRENLEYTGSGHQVFFTRRAVLPNQASNG
jgi:hypothetical protein